MTAFKQFLLMMRNDDGTTAVEYSLIAVAMAIVLVPAFSLTTTGLGSKFDYIAYALDYF